MLLPFAPFIAGNFVLMKDNARPYTARSTQAYLNEVDITVMDCPARSPNMNSHGACLGLTETNSKVQNGRMQILWIHYNVLVEQKNSNIFLSGLMGIKAVLRTC